MQTIPTKKPFGGRNRLLSALVALVAAGFGPASAEYNETKKRGFRHGKHNGRTAGAFGGPTRAKNHRKLYVAASEG